MIANFNKGYAIVPLIDNMIDEIDRNRFLHTKEMIICLILHTLFAIISIVLALVFKHFPCILTVIVNIVMMLMCVDRYKKFSDDCQVTYMTARSAIYGDDYASIYLNEEKLLIEYGNMRSLCTYSEDCRTIDFLVNGVSLVLQFMYLVLISVS